MKYVKKKEIKVQNQKMEYYSALQDRLKLESFNKLCSELRVATMKKDIKLVEELYIELKACIEAIKNSKINEDIKAKYYQTFYGYYTAISNLYKEQSFEDNKKHINQNLDNAATRINTIKKDYSGLSEQIDKKKNNVKMRQDIFDKFEKFAVSSTNDIEKLKKEFDILYEKERKINSKISEIQNQVMGKVINKRGKFDDAIKDKDTVAKYQKLFDKKAELERLISKINNDKVSLENELKILIKKAKSLEITHSKDMNNDIQEIQTLIKDIDIRKRDFEKEVSQFNNIIQGDFDANNR